jgi:hypothetical protein
MLFHSNPDMALVHIIALLILLGRIGDVASTLFITPHLVLEANPVVRRFKWPTIVLGFVLCLAPYVDVGLGIMIAVPSLLVTASNLSRGWVSRAVGEKEAEAFLLRAAMRGSLATVLSMLGIATAFFILAAALLLYISEGSESLEYWFGIGMILYALTVGIHGSLFAARLFRKARQGANP